MLGILLFTVNSIMPIILLMVLGYWLKCRGFFTPEFLKIGNKTVFNVCLPIFLFKTIADIEDLSLIRFDVVVYMLIVIALLFLCGLVLALFFIKEPLQKGVIHQCIFRSNFALIGVPLAELMGGESGVRTAAVLSLFSIPIFNTLAVIVLSIYKDGGVKINVKKIVMDVIRNPLIEGVLLGLVVAFVKIYMREHSIYNPLTDIAFLYTGLSYLARMATPLALLVLGGQFNLQAMADYKKTIILGVTGRTVFAPFVGVGGAVVLTKMGIVSFDPGVFAALIALFGTPVAVASAIMAEAMDNDGQLAGQLVVWTTLVSLVSLFVVIFMVRGLGLL